MRTRITSVAARFFLAVGFLALAVSGSAYAYAKVYQAYQAWSFNQQLDLTKFVRPGTAPRNTELHEGDLAGKLEIPRIGISVMVLEGVDAATLRLGAGHIPGTALLGAAGNVAIAGHRDTVFWNLRKVANGDRIRLSTLAGDYDYVVRSTEIVRPEDTAVLDPTDQSELTLVTCYPFYYIGPSPKRFIVHAALWQKSIDAIAPNPPSL